MSESEKSVDASSNPKNSPVGTVIAGKWKLIQRLGRGGIGHVYEAEQVGGTRRVAIKLLRKAQDWDDEAETIVDRFYHEAQILRRLQHPGIIEVYDFGFEEDLGFYLIMELLQGQSLLTYMQKNTGLMPWDLLYQVIKQVCDAMGFAHKRNIVHRDLKPEHIFLLGDPNQNVQVKVFDFGIARFEQEEGNERLTQQGVTLGTPRYLSPEQTMGGDIDHRSDIYTLSIILFELLTRRRVFQVEGAFQLMTHHAYVKAPTLSEARPDLNFPPALEELVTNSLAKERDIRPQSMEDFRQLLYQALQEKLTTPEALPSTLLKKQVQVTGSFYMVGGRRPRPNEAEPQRDPEEIAKKLERELSFKLEPLHTPSPLQPPQLAQASDDEAAPKPSSTADFTDTPIPRDVLQEAAQHHTESTLGQLQELQEEDESIGDSTGDTMLEVSLLAPLGEEDEEDGEATAIEPAIQLEPLQEEELDLSFIEFDDSPLQALDSMDSSAQLPQVGTPIQLEQSHADPDTMLEPSPLLSGGSAAQTPLPYTHGSSEEYRSLSSSGDNAFAFVGGSHANLPIAQESSGSSFASLSAAPASRGFTSSSQLPSSVSTMKPVLPRTPDPMQQEQPKRVHVAGEHRPRIRSAKFQDVLQKEREENQPVWMWVAIGLGTACLIAAVVYFLFLK